MLAAKKTASNAVLGNVFLWVLLLPVLVSLAGLSSGPLVITSTILSVGAVYAIWFAARNACWFQAVFAVAMTPLNILASICLGEPSPTPAVFMIAVYCATALLKH